MKLLLIEDSLRLQRSLGRGLRQAGYAVDLTGDGNEGLWYAQTNEYDVIVLDLMLPGLDGLSILRRLRAEGNPTHVLILTARDGVEDRVAGLKAGADDYLVKPFSFDELEARIQALIRRKHGAKNPRLRVGEMEVDTASRSVRLKGQTVLLTAREYAILEFLALRSGEVVSRTEIEQRIYDERVEPVSNVVDSAICALRRKLESAGECGAEIVTRRGMGYSLQAGGA